MFKKFTLGAAAAVAAIGTLPATAAQAHDNGYYGRSSYEQGQQRYRRCSGTTGTILGAAAGALLGRAIDTRGSRVVGTVAGGAGGAVLGRKLGRSTCRNGRF
jgi:outer membrane lipoprotein SlyB